MHGHVMGSRKAGRWGRVALGASVMALGAFGAIPATAQARPASPAAQIRANWTAFFSGKTPAARKIALLENGTRFAPVIRAQSGLGAAAAAKVLAVTNVTKTTARVRYTITLGGAPALPNQAGTAVYENKVWKVGDASFCALLALEGTKTPACPKR